ncbi:MAG: DUF6786 family protein [Prevotella sp.]|jgi:hypothetical protein
MNKHLLIASTLLLALTACSEQKDTKMGSYEYDAQFLKEHNVGYIELKSNDGNSKVMVAPEWQGRVVTSTASGDEGDSYGWINYRFIEAGQPSDQFNPYGGEERFWLGPEGGPYSLYFENGKEQVYDNWHVPAVIDTEAYDVDSKNDTSVCFKKSTSVKNASGTVFDLDIERTINLLSRAAMQQRLGITIPEDAKIVGYESLNKITNTGKEAWTKEKGLISIWMLGHFNPTPTTTVFIPYNEDAEGKIVNDEYFGKIPADRLKTGDGMLYFKIDGKLRSKLGIPPARSKGMCCSYDSEKNVLTILRCSVPEKPGPYLNGQWGKQDDPFAGDMLNSYNDGPVEDGSIMGPFYEIETSSPGAELGTNESMVHQQEIFHIQADEAVLDPIVEKLFGVNIATIKSQFQP